MSRVCDCVTVSMCHCVMRVHEQNCIGDHILSAQHMVTMGMESLYGHSFLLQTYLYVPM